MGTGDVTEGAATGRGAGRPEWPAMKAFSFATSSSVKLASAEPLPGSPALVQMSTKSLLSSLSSFASV
jgi:hypothetical protein